MTRLATLNDFASTAAGFTITDSGTVTADTTIKFEGVNSISFGTASAYRQLAATYVLGRWYYMAFTIRPGSLPSADQSIVRMLDAGGNNVGPQVFLMGVGGTIGQIRAFNSGGSGVGNGVVVDLDYFTLVEIGWQQQAAGNGNMAMWVNGQEIVPVTSASLGNVVANRIRIGRPIQAATIDSLHIDSILLNDDQSGSNNTWVHPTPIPPGEPGTILNPTSGRRLGVPIGTAQVNNIYERQANDRFVIRWVPDASFHLNWWWSGFNLEGVYTDSANVAAPAEIRTNTLNKQTINASYPVTPAGLPGGWTVGTGRPGYAHGNGGTVKAELCTCLVNGLPNLSNVIATETVNPVDRWIAADTIINTTSLGQAFLYFNFNVDVVADTMYAVVFTNVHADPLNNFFSINMPLASVAAAGPHAVNTLSKYADGAMAGLDPRECCMWSIDAGADWYFGAAVGADTLAEGAEDRPGGHIFGYYIGTGDEAVKLPWYGFSDAGGGNRLGIQPYYNYLTQGTHRLVCRKVARAATLTEAGGYAPVGQNVGVVTVKNEFTGVTATTASLGSGLVKGALSAPVPVSPGEVFSISNTGVVYREEGDDFLVKAWGIGSGRFPFTTDGQAEDRALLFALPWPYFASPARPLSSQVWPVISTAVNASLGATYAPLAYPATATKRYIHAQNGNDANDGLTWATAWKGLYNAWETAVTDPGGTGVEIWCDGIFDLTNAAQFYPASMELLIANCIDGTAAAPRSVRAMPGCEVINGHVTLRTPNYTRVSGFIFDGKGIAADILLRVESATTTVHFEHSYNTYRGARDQAVLIDTGSGADFHGYNNRYELNGNYRHPDLTRGHFDQPIYVKKCPRYLEVNPVFVGNVGGYGFHAYDSATSDPANAARLLHATSVGTQPFAATGDTVNTSPTISNAVPAAGKTFRLGQVITGTGMGTNAQIDAIAGSGPYTLTMSANCTATNTGVALTVNTPSSGGVVDNGANIVIANSIFKDHHGSGVNASVMGKTFRFINTVTGSQFRANLQHNNLNGLDAGGATVVGGISVDPQFLDATAEDFTLLAGSPAGNVGEAWGVLVDHDGRTRSPTTPSLGAFNSQDIVPALVAVGTAASGDAIDLTPALPAGVAAGQVMLCCVAYRGGTVATVATPAGWTQAFQDSNSTEGLLALFWRAWQSGDAAPTIDFTTTAAGGDTFAQIATFTGLNTANPIDVLGTPLVQTASQQDIGPIPGLTPGIANSGIVVMGMKRDDWTSVATLTGESLAWQELGEPFSVAGTDAGMVWDFAPMPGAAVAVAAKTYTVTGGAAGRGRGRMLSLRPLKLLSESKPLPVRNFDGANDSVHVAIGNCNLIGAFTTAVLFKLNVLGQWHSLIANHASAGTTTVAMEVDNTNHLHLTDGVADVAMAATLVAGRWYLGVGRKAAGSAAARLSLYDFTAGTWTHETLGLLGNGATTAGGTIRFGEWQGTDDLNGRLAVAAEWATDLTDPQVLALETGHSTANWLALGPVGLWEFNQEPM